MNTLRALEVLRENVRALLRHRFPSETAFAFAVGKNKAWINKFLNGHRGIRIADVGLMADRLGVEPWQLFQPGTSALTERRVNPDRRSGKDRRQAFQRWALRGVTDIVNSDLRPVGAQPSTPQIDVASLLEMRAQIDQLLAATNGSKKHAKATVNTRRRKS